MARNFKVDRPTDSIVITPYEQHKINAGDHFYFMDTANLGASGTANYMIITPDTTKWGHMTIGISTIGDTMVTLDESVSGSSTGSTVTVFNRNRNSSTTPGVVITRMAVGATDGTLVWNTYIAEDGKIKGSPAGQNELVLKQNTKYLLLLKSATASNVLTTIFDWYEFTDESYTT